MDLDRLGTLYPYPLSFMRSLVRRIMTEGWSINRTKFALDSDGYGEAIYSVDTGQGTYNFVIFSHYLDPADRSDRVIAEKWDMTATFCAGELTDDRLQQLRINVPLQEAGRVDSDCLVLTRANRSLRNYSYVIDCLSNGVQPDVDVVAKVGYIFRTTAVYGSGKLGMADWEKICLRYPEFARPFMAEMLACFLIRQFAFELTDWVASQNSSEKYVPLDEDIKRYIGIGNATGLGMAPYLITHPQLISNWIYIRETALRRVCEQCEFTDSSTSEFLEIANKAIQHLAEIETDNLEQNLLNETAKNEIVELATWAKHADLTSWQSIVDHAASNYNCEAQELVNSIILEVHKTEIYDLEEELVASETYDLIPEMKLSELKAIMESHYDWAIDADYSTDECLDTFWYRSEEKMEPRLGRRSQEPGAEKEMFLGIGWATKCCHQMVSDHLKNSRDCSVARFVFEYPKYRYIIRRVQTMAQTKCGEIRANLLDAKVLPIHLLRCKLSFFGVGRFDPKSRLWVRNTMFQGAPLISDIGKPFQDDWCFPVKPNV